MPALPPVNIGSLEQVLSLSTQYFSNNVSILVGIKSNGDLKPIAIDDLTGELIIGGVTINPGTINIGAVQIKDPVTTKEVNVIADGSSINAVSVISQKGNTMTPTASSVSPVAVLLIAANVGRKTYSIQNIGSNTIYIGGTSGVIYTTGFPIPAGATYSDSNYSGDVYAICATGQSSSTRNLEISIS